MSHSPNLKAKQYQIEKFAVQIRELPSIIVLESRVMDLHRDPKKVMELGRNTPSFTGTNTSYWCISVSCEMKWVLKDHGPRFKVPCGGSDLQQHLLLWREEQLTAQPCNNSYFFNIPSKQTQSPTRLRPAVKRLWSHLCMPEQAGTQTGQSHGGVKLLLGGTLNAPAAFTWQIQHQAQGQWDINLHPDMLQPSKKGSESRQREELLKDDLEMTWKSRESLTIAWPFPSTGNQRRNKPWELTGYRGKTENWNKLPTAETSPPK